MSGSGSRTDGSARVLVVDDEPMVCEVVARYLERDGHEVRTADNGGAALELIESDPPDLVVLDVMLPTVDGLDVLSRVRARSELPVILLTARSDETDRVVGLELGADDYVVKPFSPRELAARVKSVLRRSRAAPPTAPLSRGGLTIDPVTREVAVDDTPVDLTRREFELLLFLAGAPRQVFTREQLLQHVWDSSSEWQDPATVTVHIRRLRTKLRDVDSPPRWIETVWGVGYRFVS